MKSSLYHRYDVTDLRKHITLTKIPYTPCFHVKCRCLCLQTEPVLPVYDRPQLSSSLPSRLQNVCLCLSRFTSDVPIPTIYINTQRVQLLSLNKPTVFSDTPSFRNHSADFVPKKHFLLSMLETVQRCFWTAVYIFKKYAKLLIAMWLTSWKTQPIQQLSSLLAVCWQSAESAMLLSFLPFYTKCPK